MKSNAQIFEHAINSVFPRDLRKACRVATELGLEASGIDSGNGLEFADGSTAVACWTGSMRGYWVAES